MTPAATSSVWSMERRNTHSGRWENNCLKLFALDKRTYMYMYLSWRRGQERCLVLFCSNKLSSDNSVKTSIKLNAILRIHTVCTDWNRGVAKVKVTIIKQHLYKLKKAKLSSHLKFLCLTVDNFVCQRGFPMFPPLHEDILFNFALSYCNHAWKQRSIWRSREGGHGSNQSREF